MGGTTREYIDVCRHQTIPEGLHSSFCQAPQVAEGVRDERGCSTQHRKCQLNAEVNKSAMWWGQGFLEQSSSAVPNFSRNWNRNIQLAFSNSTEFSNFLFSQKLKISLFPHPKQERLVAHADNDLENKAGPYTRTTEGQRISTDNYSRTICVYIWKTAWNRKYPIQGINWNEFCVEAVEKLSKTHSRREKSQPYRLHLF